MSQIHVFVDDKHQNQLLFYGKSTSEMTSDAKIIPVSVNSRDELIAYAIKTAPKDSYILCAYGALLTALTSKSIYDALEYVISNIEFDAFYLTLYGDSCSFSSDEHTYDFMTIRRSISPHGTECILFSPEGVNKIVNTFDDHDGRGFDYHLNNRGEKMLLYTSFPPLINVDLNKRDKDTQLVKGTICRENINLERPIEISKRYNGNMNLFWFFLVVIFILFISAMLISFGPKNSSNLTPTTTSVDKKKTAGVPMGKQDPTGDLTEIN
uniref:Uncharacterized protein n=1 Tax=viral metagenome TaxID=1070528 RepID=A0A6C0BE01_9ZZZZ